MYAFHSYCGKEDINHGLDYNELVVRHWFYRYLSCCVYSIAHRMRTVANAHKIVVLKDGTVAEQGTPAELMARGGEFARMVERQREAS